jgi:hypothetical protein
MSNIHLCLIALAMGTAAPAAQAGDLKDGFWIGKVTETTYRADGSQSSGSFGMMLRICNRRVQVGNIDEEGKITGYAPEMTILSEADTHLIVFSHADQEQPGWEEHQTFSLLDLGDGQGRLQWTRAVNNRDKAVEDRIRSFFSHGIADLKLMPLQCDTGDEEVDETDAPARDKP